MNAQQLKNSILQEAIEGRLVPQDPNDEPASVLLDKIRKEKAKLVKEGKLKKKDLEETPISEDEKPFNIPKSWKWIRIKSIFSMQAGKNVTSADINSEQNSVFKYPCYGGNGLRGYVRYFNTEGIYPLVGRQGALCGNVNMAEGKFWATEHAVVTDGYNMTDVKWQFYFLTALNLNRFATATAQPGLAVSNVIEAPIPLPPLAEQKRIVAKIEELLPKVEEYGKAQEALDKLNEELPERLKKSILQEAIEGRLVPQDPNDEPASLLHDKIRKEKARLVKEGKLKKKDIVEKPISEDEIPFKIPKSWEWVKLGNVSEIARGGSPRPIKDYLTEDAGGLNWIKIGDTDKGGKYINSCKEKIKPEGLKKTRVVHPGDFLLTNSMSFGRPYITNIEGCIHDGWIMISPYAGVFDQSYLYYVLSSAFAHKQFSDKVAGAVVQNLNSDKVADSLIPLSPLTEQNRIVDKIEQLFHEIDKLKV